MTGAWKSPGAALTTIGVVELLRLPAGSAIAPAEVSDTEPASPGLQGCEDSR